MLQGELAYDKEGLRIGYTVTKKTGNAVERNRIKRRLRMAVAEAFLTHEEQAQTSHGKVGGQMIVIARRDALGEPYGGLVANLTKGIDRLLSKGKKAGNKPVMGK